MLAVCRADDRSAAAHDPAHSRRRRRARNQVGADAAVLHFIRAVRVASLHHSILADDPRDRSVGRQDRHEHFCSLLTLRRPQLAAKLAALCHAATTLPCGGVRRSRTSLRCHRRRAWSRLLVYVASAKRTHPSSPRAVPLPSSLRSSRFRSRPTQQVRRLSAAGGDSGATAGTAGAIAGAGAGAARYICGASRLTNARGRDGSFIAISLAQARQAVPARWRSRLRRARGGAACSARFCGGASCFAIATS